MKNTLKLLSLLFVVLFTVTSCSKDDDPVDNDLFVGTYTGDIGYSDLSDNSNSVQQGPGKVIVTKVGGDNYSFKFDNNIPDLNNIKMEKGENNTIFFGDGLGTITISESSLQILYTSDEKSWSADCSR